MISCPHCGRAIPIEHAPDVRVEHLPDDLREYYEDATRVLEAVGAHASHIDERTARRALQFTTQVLRNLFESPPELAASSQPEDEPE